VSFVVEEFPFRQRVVVSGTNGVVGVAKSFDAGAEEGMFEAKFGGALPDNSADIEGIRAANTKTGFSLGNDVLGLLR